MLSATDIGCGLTSRRSAEFQARSSGVEHHLDTVGVSGSIPLVPTNSSRGPVPTMVPSQSPLWSELALGSQGGDPLVWAGMFFGAGCPQPN